MKEIRGSLVDKKQIVCQKLQEVIQVVSIVIIKKIHQENFEIKIRKNFIFLSKKSN